MEPRKDMLVVYDPSKDDKNERVAALHELVVRRFKVVAMGTSTKKPGLMTELFVARNGDTFRGYCAPEHTLRMYQEIIVPKIATGIYNWSKYHVVSVEPAVRVAPGPLRWYWNPGTDIDKLAKDDAPTAKSLGV